MDSFRTFVNAVHEEASTSRIVSTISLPRDVWLQAKSELIDHTCTCEERYEYDVVGDKTFIRSDCYLEQSVIWVQKHRRVFKEGDSRKIYSEDVRETEPHSSPLVLGIRRIQIWENRLKDHDDEHGTWHVVFREETSITAPEAIPRTVEESNIERPADGRPTFHRKARLEMARAMYDELESRTPSMWTVSIDWRPPVRSVTDDGQMCIDTTDTNHKRADPTKFDFDEWKNLWSKMCAMAGQGGTSK